jgi:hypothetical protein
LQRNFHFTVKLFNSYDIIGLNTKKMKKNILKTVAYSTVCLGLLFTACKKKDKEAADSDTSIAEEQSVTASLSSEMADIADEATDKSNSDISSLRATEANGFSVSQCATITRFNKDSANVDTVIVDFGNGTSICKDGKTRSGQLTIIYTGGTKYRKLNSNATITTSNYTVNGHLFVGTKTIQNVTQAGGNLKFTITVNGTITTKNGNVLNYTANRTREWIAGTGTKDRSDDVIQVTGDETATNPATGKVWTATVINPLVRKFESGCKKHFVQGVVEVTISGKPNRTIDYGNGICDNIITVTINGKKYSITLK